MENYWQNSIFHEQDYYLSFEYQLEQALFYPTRYLCNSTTQSCFLQDEALLHGDIFESWPDLEDGAHHKGEQELKQKVGGDAAAKTREGSEETVFSSSQHLRSSTSSSQSCLSQECFLATLEGDHHKAEKDLKRKFDRAAGEKKRKWRLRNGPEETPFTFELVSGYFCMPVKQAAEELDVGLTHLKRKCREVGIPRWPHRKVKSLELLIKNAQELGKPEIEVERLRQKKKLIEETPGHVELDEETRVLRQACFKEKFKMKRLKAIEG